jgi:hypothetical protein
MPFDAESFLGDDIALSDVTGLVKDDLKTLARYLKIQFDSECKKPVLKELVVTCLVDIAKLPSSAIDTLLAGGGAGMYELEKAKLRLAERELELKYQAEQEARHIRMRELDLEMRKLNMESGYSNEPKVSSDVSKFIRLVPKFSEKDVDKFFTHFEKMAISLKWPKDIWTVLVQSVFVGKAQDIFSALSLEQCQNYEIVKIRVLKAYELVPEAYRQKFRQASKQSNQSYVEFAQHKQNLFDKWLSSRKVTNVLREKSQIYRLQLSLLQMNTY